MTNPPGRSSSREKLLDAAAGLISEHGVQELTLEGVAAAAGVTKGGLIYHFKTREDLLGALVERMTELLDQGGRGRAAKRGDTPTALLLALIDDAFEMPRGERLLRTNLLAIGRQYPHLLGPVQRAYGRVYKEFIDSSPQTGLALTIAASLHGLSLLELLDLHQFNKRQREAMRQTLKQLVQTVAA